MDRIIRRLLNYLPWLQRFAVVKRVEAADEIPESLPQFGAVLVGSEAAPRWLAFDCPCRTGHRIMLNLDNSRRPFWMVSSTKHLTIHPSVDSRRPERRCHYWMRNGKIHWVPSATRS